MTVSSPKTSYLKKSSLNINVISPAFFCLSQIGEGCRGKETKEERERSHLLGKAMLKVGIMQASDPKSNIQIESITAEKMKNKPHFLLYKFIQQVLIGCLECAK